MLRVLHQPTRTALAGATTQQAQAEALIAEFGGLNVTVRVLGAGGVLRQTVTLAPWTISSTTPREVRHGARLAFTTNSTGDTESIEYRSAGGVLVFAAWADEAAGPAIVDFFGPIRTRCPVKLAAVVYAAQAGLPVVGETAPTTATLSISSSATSGAATPAAVTLNAPALEAYTVTWSFAGSPTLTGVLGGTSTIAIGQTTHPAVTASWAAAGGPHAVDFTISPSLTRAGRPVSVTVSAPVSAGEWQTLTVAAHSRKVIRLSSGNGANQTYTTTNADAIEAQAPETVTRLPAKQFGMPVMGERGTIYYAGGLHPGYQGNEIDRLALPLTSATEIGVTLSHQPNIPPEGAFSGYGTGGSGYIWRQHGTFADPSLWQPHPGHQWTRQTWDPYHGYTQYVAHALQTSYPDGSYVVTGGVLQSSVAQPTTTVGSESDTQGLVSFDFDTGKYTTWFTQVGKDFEEFLTGHTGMSDWNNWDQSLIALQTNAGITRIKRWNPITGWTALGNTTLIGGADKTGGNGVLIRHLEDRKYLVLRMEAVGAWSVACKLMLYSERFGSGDARFVTLTPPAGECGDANTTPGTNPLTFAVDKTSRRVFWMVFPGMNISCRFYVSTFDDLMTWTPLGITPAYTVTDANAFNYAWLGANRNPMFFQDGWLFLQEGESSGISGNPGWNTDGQSFWRRVKVDGGEALPELTFTRYDYRVQNFQFSSDPGVLQLWGNKHANWAYRPTDGKHYLCAGDLGGAFNHSMASLSFSGTAPGDYVFTELMNETSDPPAGFIRPTGTDDGYWFFVPSTSAWVAARGKFVWQRGGDGIQFFGNTYLRAAYGATSESDPVARAAAEANGWDGTAKFYLYDPANNRFDGKIDGTGWAAQDNGGNFYEDVWTTNNSKSRCGAFDHSTGCLYRFYQGGRLIRFDFVSQTIKVFNIGKWTSPATSRVYFAGGIPALPSDVVADGDKPAFGYFDTADSRWKTALALEWEHKAVWIDERDGKLYAVDSSTGYLWCFETRGTETLTDDGWVLPFGPVGDRIPFVGVYPPLDAFAEYPPVRAPVERDTRMNSFLVPFKGGLLWWGCAHHTAGTFGHPIYAFWRRLDYTGPWSVVSMPRELAANTYSVVSTAHDNSEVVMLSGGGNVIETQGPWPFFWRLT
jgi:hypothetical protein